VPAAQSSQACDPEVDLNLPCSHASQSVPVYPEAHSHCDNDVEASGEVAVPGAPHNVHAVIASDSPYFPDTQFMHSVVPAEAVIFPATHAVQVPPAGPAYPASHRQEPDVSVAVVEKSGHAWQTVDAVFAAKLPVPQSSHSKLPSAALYLPVAQAEHVEPSSP